MTLSTAINGGGSGGGASARSAKVANGATGVVATISTGLKAPLTVARDSGSTSITFAAAGNKLTASIASSLAIGSSLFAIARVTQADGAGVLIPVTLTGVAAAPTLSALTLSATTATVGTAATINIVGATAGSTITGTVPDGMTLNSGARTITGTPTTAGTYNFTLTETLAGATNTPNTSNVTVTVAASGGAKPLRTVANNAFVQSGMSLSAANGNAHGFIATYTIGSGDVDSLCLSLHNCLTNGGDEISPGATLTFGALYLVYNGVAVQVKVSSNGTIVLADGANDVVSEGIPVSVFGVSSIPRGAEVEVRGYCYRPAGNYAAIPATQTIQVGFYPNDEAFRIDTYWGIPPNIAATDHSSIFPPSPLTNIVLDGTNATATVIPINGKLPQVGMTVLMQTGSTTAYTGSSTFNGGKVITAVDTVNNTISWASTSTTLPPAGKVPTWTPNKVGSTVGYRPILLGTFVSGDPRTEFIGGDSIDWGYGDTASAGPLNYGTGFNVRSLRDEDTLANPVAYINCAIGGSGIQHFIGSNQRTWAYMKYCKYGSGKHITNTMVPTGTATVTAAQFLDNMRQWWAAMKANGIQQVLAISAPPRVTLAAQAITSVVVASNVATVTTAAAHNLNSGTLVVMAGATPSGLNGNKTVTVTGANTFTYPTSGIADQTATGTITYKDNLATYQSQITGPDYDAGGKLETYYSAMPAEIAAGRIDGFIMIDAWRGPSPNQYKWIVNGTNNYASAETEGLHPSGIICRNAGLELKAKKAAMGWV